MKVRIGCVWGFLLVLQVAPPSPAMAQEAPPEAVTDETATRIPAGFLGFRNRVAVSLGAQISGQYVLGVVTPGMNLSMDVAERPLSLTIAVPLRIDIMDLRAQKRLSGAGKFATRDWTHPRDMLWIIQNLTWGDRKGHFLLDFNRFQTATLGHGTIMRRHFPNVLLDAHRLSFHGQAFSDWAGGEAYIDNLAGPQVVGGRVRFSPLAFVSRKNPYLRTFYMGFTAAADVDAPLRNHLDLDDVDNDGRRSSEVLIPAGGRNPVYDGTSVLAWGVDMGIRLAETREVAYDTYFDYSFLVSALPGDDPAKPVPGTAVRRGVRSAGFTWGHLLKLKLGWDGRQELEHGLLFRFEYRNMDANYQSGYFDLPYGAQRIAYTRGALEPAAIANGTKVQTIMSRTGPRAHGGYFELAYQLVGYMTASVGFEFNDRYPDNSMFVHLEVPEYKDWQFSFTYHRRNASGFKDLWDWYSGEGHDVFVARSRYMIADIFGMTLEAMTPFGLGRDNAYGNAWQVGLYADLGWSFGRMLGDREGQR